MVGWDTTSSEYSPDNFYVEASDKKGHVTQMRVNIPPNIAGLLGNIIERGQVPAYRNKNDVIRDALYHRLEYIGKLVADDEIDQRLTLMRASYNAVKREQEMDVADQHIDRCERILNRYRMNGQYESMQEFCEEQIENLHLFPVEQRKRMSALLERYQII